MEENSHKMCMQKVVKCRCMYVIMGWCTEILHRVQKKAIQFEGARAAKHQGKMLINSLCTRVTQTCLPLSEVDFSTIEDEKM